MLRYDSDLAQIVVLKRDLEQVRGALEHDFGVSHPIASALLIMAALGIGAVLMLIAFVVMRLVG